MNATGFRQKLSFQKTIPHVRVQRADVGRSAIKSLALYFPCNRVEASTTTFESTGRVMLCTTLFRFNEKG